MLVHPGDEYVQQWIIDRHWPDRRLRLHRELLVPDIPSWLSMLVGFAGIGGLLRRRGTGAFTHGRRIADGAIPADS